MPGADGSDEQWVLAMNRGADDLGHELDRWADEIADEVAGLSSDVPGLAQAKGQKEIP